MLKACEPGSVSLALVGTCLCASAVVESCRGVIVTPVCQPWFQSMHHKQSCPGFTMLCYAKRWQ